MRNIIVIFTSILVSLRAFASLSIYSPEAVQRSLNAGWPAYTSPIQKKLDANKSYLIWFSELPDRPFDFRSADGFHHSLTAGLGDIHRVGHNIYGWSCPRFSKGPHVGTASQTGEDDEQTSKMVDAGWGIAALFATFQDGLFFNSTLNQRLLSLWNHHDVQFFTMITEVSDEDCENVVNWTLQYTTRKEVGAQVFYPFQHFGLKPNTKNFEGGACGTVAMTALSQGNFFTVNGQKTDEAFWRNLSFKSSLFGNVKLSPEKPIISTQFYVLPNVPEGTVINKTLALGLENWNPGKNEDTSLTTVHLPDPEMFTLFYKELLSQKLKEELNNNTFSEAQAEQIFSPYVRKVHELKPFVDAREIMGYPKDQTSRQTKFPAQVIDETYDAKAQQVVSGAKAFYANKIEQGYKVEFLQLNNKPVLIFQK